MNLFALTALVAVAISCGEKEPINGGQDNSTNNPGKEESETPVTPPSGEEPEDSLELKDFVKVESNGKYRYLASSDNVFGEGEECEIPTTYYIAKYAVTCAEWSEFVKRYDVAPPKYWSSTNAPKGRENHPVLWISYDQAMEYCAWLNMKNDKWKFRLPTAAEWEYAATGKNRTEYPWGDSSDVSYDGSELTSKYNYNGVVAADVLKNPDRIATYNNEKSDRYGEQERIGDIISISYTGGVSGWVNHADYTGFIYTDIFSEINNAGGNTCAVDAYPEGVSWCGCYNMSGNCWEWTSTVEIATNGAEKGQEVNVVRGGSWYATSRSCRVSFRGEGRRASGKYNTIGFRLVAELR